MEVIHIHTYIFLLPYFTLSIYSNYIAFIYLFQLIPIIKEIPHKYKLIQVKEIASYPHSIVLIKFEAYLLLCSFISTFRFTSLFVCYLLYSCGSYFVILPNTIYFYLLLSVFYLYAIFTPSFLCNI